jgi:uncharacterized membrane protein YwaF
MALLPPFFSPLSNRQSQSSARNGYKKFMTHFLCLFHSLFFKMHVKQTPQKSDSVVSVLLVHIMFILMGGWSCSGAQKKPFYDLQ